MSRARIVGLVLVGVGVAAGHTEFGDHGCC